MARPPILVVQLDRSDPPGPLGDWLTAAGATLRVCDLSRGDPLPELDDVAGVVVLGGRMSAFDDARAPWLPLARGLLRDTLAAETPTLGICLGSQLLAVAAGGAVAANPDGPEYGAGLVAKRAAAATDPLFGPLPITPDVIQWHHNAVTLLPPGAVLLAASPVCEAQAFRVGRLAWGIQFHIETTPALVREWVAEDAARLVDHDIQRLLARSDAAHCDVAEAWAPFAAAFAGVVADPASVRPPRRIMVTPQQPITDPAQIRAALAREMRAASGHPGPTRLPDPGSPGQSRPPDR